MARPNGNTQNPPARTGPSGGRGSDDGSSDNARPRHQKEFRETVESIIIAFILAFLFRTFEAEAFVIPTGSMAPTLRGRHKEAQCDACLYPIVVGASDEVDQFGFLMPEAYRVEHALCPNCRRQIPVDDLPVFKGDRILVNKFPYEFGQPERWDVFVFKYPEEPKTNYIKRLVGLPDETIEFRQGDVYRVEPDGTRTILRKESPSKQRELQILVYDNNFPETPLHDLGWPERWAPVRQDGSPEGIAGWGEDGDGWAADPSPRGRSFELPRERAREEHRWIRYRHIVPEEGDWRAAEERRPFDREPRPELILDFAGYNAYTLARALHGQAADRGLYWVGDLTLSAQIDVVDTDPDGEVLLELNKGARKYRARLQLATGEAHLSHTVPASIAEEEEERLATAATRVRGPGSYWLSFANVDNRLVLWVDGRVVEFGDDVAYEPHGGLQRQAPTESDLIPAGIAARGATVRASNLLLERDIYYRNDVLHPADQFRDGESAGGTTIYEYGREQRDHERLREMEELRRLRFDPEDWYREYVRGLSSERTGPGEEFHGVPFHFVLGPDEYFAAGDNSPRSKDSRLWSNVRGRDSWLSRSFLRDMGRPAGRARRHAVPGESLVGKAFFIYWPHGVPFLNEGRGFPDDEDSALNVPPINRFLYHRDQFTGQLTDYPEMRIPFYPDVGRMRRIR